MAVRLKLPTIVATLALAGCGGLPNALPAVKERNDFKGKPLSAVTETARFSRLPGNGWRTEDLYMAQGHRRAGVPDKSRDGR
jgi:hypothetical protein